MPQTVYTNREMIISGFVILACFLLSYLLPAQGLYQNSIVLVSFLVLIPIFYIKIILKKELKEFGVQWGSWKVGLAISGISLAFSLMLAYILFNYTGFLKTQEFLKVFQNQFIKFVAYEFFSVGILVAVFEFFFRGFVLKTFRSKFGYWTVAIQLIIFLAYAMATQSFNLGMAYFFIIALFSGLIVYYSHSILYSFLYGWVFILIADAIVIRLSK